MFKIKANCDDNGGDCVRLREVMNVKNEVKLEVEKECKSREKVEKKKVNVIRIGK